MRILDVNYPENLEGIKLYANVPSNSKVGEFHLVVYIRTAHTRAWHCTCKDYAFRKRAARRSCEHIREVRSMLGKTR